MTYPPYSRGLCAVRHGPYYPHALIGLTTCVLCDSIAGQKKAAKYYDLLSLLISNLSFNRFDRRSFKEDPLKHLLLVKPQVPGLSSLLLLCLTASPFNEMRYRWHVIVVACLAQSAWLASAVDISRVLRRTASGPSPISVAPSQYWWATHECQRSSGNKPY